MIKQINKAYNKQREKKKKIAVAITINQEKRKPWENLCTSLNFKTPTRKV